LTVSFSIFTGVVLAIAVALLVGGLLVVTFFTAAVELVIDDVSTGTDVPPTRGSYANIVT